MHDVGVDGQLADAGHAHNDTNNQPGNDHSCNHVHAHCCAATAILASAPMTPPAADPGQLRLERNGALPYGQLSLAPLRPPRLSA
jgi:hypothetical protein